MSTTATVSRNEIVSLVASEVNKHLEPAMALLKSLEAPASKAGVSPTELVAKMTNGGQTPYVFGNDGFAMPAFQPPRNRVKSLGWGEMLSAMVGVQDPRYSGEHRAALERKLFDPVSKNGFGVTKAALAEGTGTTGGYTVPPQFVAQLMTMAVEESVVRPRATIMPMTTLTMQIPALDVTKVGAAGTANLLGGIYATWTAEAQTRVETEPTFQQIEFKAHELSFYTVASNTLLADNAIGLDSLLTMLFSTAIGWYTDYAYFNGNGVGKPLGILNAPATIAVTRASAGHFRYADVAAMMSKIYWPQHTNASLAWVISQSVIPDILQMTDPAGRVIFIPLSAGVQAAIPQSAGVMSMGSLLGIPVLVTEKVPALGTAGDVQLIDFSKYILADRMELQIDVSPHVKFLNNQMVWRVLWRGDGMSWLKSYITLQDGVTTVSPFVKLS